MADDSRDDADGAGSSVVTQQVTAVVLHAVQDISHQMAQVVRPYHEAMERLRASIEPVRGVSELMAQTVQPYHEVVQRVMTSVEPIRGVTELIAQTVQPHHEAIQRVMASVEPSRGVTELIAQTVRQYQEAVQGVIASMKPVRGILEQFNTALRPVFDLGWLDAIQKRFNRFEEALAKADTMGAAGWTIPLNADLDECIRLLHEATSPEAADRAFVDFYSKNDGAHQAELLAGLHQHPKLKEFQGLLEEVIFALAAQKYILAVPALLAAFEGVARRCWDDGAWAKKGRDTFFDRKLQSLNKGSYDHVTWSATRAFVEALYSPNREKDPKPLILNRHWVLHGRGPADGTLSDCLRLLQAIHTVLTLAEDETA